MSYANNPRPEDFPEGSIERRVAERDAADRRNQRLLKIQQVDRDMDVISSALNRVRAQQTRLGWPKASIEEITVGYANPGLLGKLLAGASREPIAEKIAVLRFHYEVSYSDYHNGETFYMRASDGSLFHYGLDGSMEPYDLSEIRSYLLGHRQDLVKRTLMAAISRYIS